MKEQVSIFRLQRQKERGVRAKPVLPEKMFMNKTGKCEIPKWNKLCRVKW